MKIGKISHRCSICEREIIQNKYSWLLIDGLLFDFKIHLHYKIKHRERYFTVKGIIKRISFLIPFTILNVLGLILLVITYPFWALHELLGGL